mmetsp:Transcript_12083/g.41874  ORF Transcript_12083/g.41874 Transcript_12083/m.41874 type:complete len:298 (+) Transcript_12083:134-1027(+)|eukprot:CAMPEP_0183819504 /NCGR_PEP_ID=MMETSP0803_2-20130417/64173_1 /TAXON_ID=195967 /ORGANISM="Crustomastix stigmata, Strain CCMP3273" /LENGTH=297 /DNA_ID=CAMNT_0026064393 /DNA_START=108 /DNA_END=1001 /DNA_ORIENTATION=+
MDEHQDMNRTAGCMRFRPTINPLWSVNTEGGPGVTTKKERVLEVSTRLPQFTCSEVALLHPGKQFVVEDAALVNLEDAYEQNVGFELQQPEETRSSCSKARGKPEPQSANLVENNRYPNFSNSFCSFEDSLGCLVAELCTVEHLVFQRLNTVLRTRAQALGGQKNLSDDSLVNSLKTRFVRLKSKINDAVGTMSKSMIHRMQHCDMEMNFCSHRGINLDATSHTNMTNYKVASNTNSLLKDWLLENFEHPYPTENEKERLGKLTGLTRTQISNWFINQRVRLWRPMILRIAAENKET